MALELPKCQQQEDSCRTAPEANEAFCTSQLCGCEAECQKQEDQCRTAQGANEAFCSSQRAGCDGYIAGQPSTLPTSIYSLCGTGATSTPPSYSTSSSSAVSTPMYSTTTPVYPTTTVVVSTHSASQYKNMSTPSTATASVYPTGPVSGLTTITTAPVTGLSTAPVSAISTAIASGNATGTGSIPPQYTGAAAALPRAAGLLSLAGGVAAAAVLML